jgi:hypothetical protein
LDVSKNTKLSWFNCYDNDLTALNLSANTVLAYLHCGANPLTAAALNAMFATLHTNTIPGVTKEIYIVYATGAAGCNKTIATNRGWTVI